MKHCFIIYDMVNISKKEKDDFIFNLKEQFYACGYEIKKKDPEVSFVWSREAYLCNDDVTQSAIVISDDSICHSEAPYKVADEIWNIPQKIDAVVVYGMKSVLTQDTIRTPLFKWHKLNYIKLTATLIHQNT